LKTHLKEWHVWEGNTSKPLFKAEERASIVEVVRLAQLFPRFVEEEDNRSLMEEVSEEELKEALHSFQKDKIPRTRWVAD
jgi:hypothetical protein